MTKIYHHWTHGHPKQSKEEREERMKRDNIIWTEKERQKPDDGTERLCSVLYDRPSRPKDYLVGSRANMLFDAAEEIEHLRQSQQKLWGAADEAHMIEIENVVSRACEDTCICNDEAGWDLGTCPSCEMHQLIRDRLHWSQSVNTKPT